MGLFQALSVTSLAFASSVQAAVLATGFTVSLGGVDYFLPPKAVASIFGCEEIKASFENGPFVPITVVAGNGTVDVASYSKDDVWQEGFLDGMSLSPNKNPTCIQHMLTILSNLCLRQHTSKLVVHCSQWYCVEPSSIWSIFHQCSWPRLPGLEALF